MEQNAAAFAERATSDTLSSPDWAVNIELCDIINMDPRQAKDALKILKKRLGSKNPKIQLLALFVLETLSKNCNEILFQNFVERDILRDMVKIVKKKPDLNVREKILILIDTWQEALGGARGKYPQYYAVYNQLRSAGVEFPPKEENTVPLFTPPPTQPVVDTVSPYEEAAIQASLQSDESALSLAEIRNAEELGNVLMEMLNALDPRNPEGVKDEIIVDLVDQCRTFQTSVMVLVNNTLDENVLCKGLALNDTLQRVLTRHDDIAVGISSSVAPNPRISEDSVAKLTNVNHEDDESESEDDFSQLSHRSSRDALQKPIATSNSPARASPFLPPTTSPKNSTSLESSRTFDYLSGDTYTSEKTSRPTFPPTSSPPPRVKNSRRTSPPSSDFINPTASLFSSRLPEKSPERMPSEPPLTGGFLPPPPAKYSQRQQFFEKQQNGGSGGSRSSSGSGSSYDGLVGQTQNLSLSSLTKKEQSEDALFKDLVDFAKSKSTSAPNNRSL